MKKTTLYIILFSAAPLCLQAQFGGGNGNGEVLKPITTLQLNGSAVSIYGGSNGRGETLLTQTTNQLNGDTISVYGGGNGRGETFIAVTNNQVDGTMPNIFGGGDGRGEIISFKNTNQLSGDSVDIYGGGDGRGETAKISTTNQISGDSLNIYGGGNGRGEINSTQNTLQLDGLVASIYFGGDGRGETAKTTTNVALPITLLSFGASLLDKEIKVQWQTATEINSAFFIVEKSVDGINWQQIGKVTAAGNSSLPLSYDFLDVNPVEGINYYRLKATDLDDKFEYSAIATVNYHITNLGSLISVFPNPVKYKFTLQIKGATITNKVDIKLVNIAGQTVLQKQNLNGNTFIFDISMVAKGTYFLMIDNNGTVSVAKLIKE